MMNNEAAEILLAAFSLSVKEDRPLAGAALSSAKNKIGNIRKNFQIVLTMYVLCDMIKI